MGRISAVLIGLATWAGLAPALIAQGISKQTVVKKQVALGTPATGAGGQILRRENSTFTLSKGNFESSEIASHQQSTGVRHGTHATAGKVDGLASPGTYKLFMASAVRKDFVAGSTTGAIVTVTAASTGGATGTFTRSAGSYITDGFRVGDVVRWSGFAGGSAVDNNTKNMVITALTASVMTVTTVNGSAVVADAAGDSVTGTVVGKKTWAPLTGHTDDLFTVEEWYPDVARSELFSDLKLGQMSADMPAGGNSKLSFSLVGLKRALNSAQQLTTPAVETTTDVLTAVTGVLIVGGAANVVVTGVQLTVDGGVTADGPVVGSPYSPDLARGRIKVSGQFSAYFQDASLQALFDNETPLTLVVVMASSNLAAADFIAFSMGRIKLNGDAPDDGEKGIIRTFPFTAEINTAGGAGLANDQTILSIQDSQA